MPIEEAQRSGAMMLFGEKYGDEVRVLTIGSSKELCGGVHVQRSGDIGLFKIVAETGVAAGVRRVEAVTGETALALVQQQQAMLADAAAAFKAPVSEVPAKLAQVLDNVRTLERELSRLKARLASAQGDELLAQAVEVKGARVLAAVMDGADVNALRSTIDKLRDKLKSAAVVLASDQRRQGDADRRRHRRSDRQDQGRRTRQHGRPSGRRQGWRPSGHGAGRRQRAGAAAGGAGIGVRLGRPAALSKQKSEPASAMQQGTSGWPARSRQPFPPTVGRGEVSLPFKGREVATSSRVATMMNPFDCA
jgi:alanyl-tRNA synthetase